MNDLTQNDWMKLIGCAATQDKEIYDSELFTELSIPIRIRQVDASHMCWEFHIVVFDNWDLDH